MRIKLLVTRVEKTKVSLWEFLERKESNEWARVNACLLCFHERFKNVLPKCILCREKPKLASMQLEPDCVYYIEAQCQVLFDHGPVYLNNDLKLCKTFCNS